MKETRMTKPAHDGNLDPVALLLKKGVYLDFAMPVPPSQEALKIKVSQTVSQMSHTEQIIASARLDSLSKWIDAAQSALSKSIAEQPEIFEEQAR
jgi:hypothetical protein